MNLDNYEQVTDIEINTPADIYRAMLDGYVAECLGASYSFNGTCFVTQNPIYGNCHVLILENKIEQWTLWREKQKPHWWELARFDRPILCKCWSQDYQAKQIDAIFNRQGDYFVGGYSWLYAEPLTDAEIDQLKRGL